MIYMDNAATTAIHQEVIKAMEPYLTEKFCNPSASYQAAFEVRHAIEDARDTIAKTINADTDEIFFTSGGTEADNWAINGICKYAKKDIHIITQPTEHKAVINPIVLLQKYQKAEVSFIPVNSDGMISLHSLQREINPRTCLVSIMMVNNEIGTIQQIGKIGEICRSFDIAFHTDAVQAYGHIPIDVKKQNISLLSVSGHKLGAPKGIGFLYINRGVLLEFTPMIHGGAQEFGWRAGTENVASIVGLAKAAEIAHQNMKKNTEMINMLSGYFYGKLQKELPRLSFNGIPSPYRMPSHINVCFHNYGIDGAAMLSLLDEYDICASSGSACNSVLNKPSYVLTAIGRTPEEAQSSIRFTINENNTMAEIDKVIKALQIGVDYLSC